MLNALASGERRPQTSYRGFPLTQLKTYVPQTPNLWNEMKASLLIGFDESANIEHYYYNLRPEEDTG